MTIGAAALEAVLVDSAAAGSAEAATGAAVSEAAAGVAEGVAGAAVSAAAAGLAEAVTGAAADSGAEVSAEATGAVALEVAPAAAALEAAGEYGKQKQEPIVSGSVPVFLFFRGSAKSRFRRRSVQRALHRKHPWGNESHPAHESAPAKPLPQKAAQTVPVTDKPL